MPRSASCGTTSRSQKEQGEALRIPYKIENKKAYTLITVRDDIVHQLRKGESWIVIDSWAEAGSNVVTGKLGFFIPPQ